MNEAVHRRHLDSRRLIGGDEVVQPVGDLARHARPLERHPCAEVPALDIRQDPEQHHLVKLVSLAGHTSDLPGSCWIRGGFKVAIAALVWLGQTGAGPWK